MLETVFVIGSIPGFLALWRSRRRRDRFPGRHCLHCGYDLRASKDRCPECGTAFSSTQARSEK
jgi:predicted amidophosphoribosyltransferase